MQRRKKEIKIELKAGGKWKKNTILFYIINGKFVY